MKQLAIITGCAVSVLLVRAAASAAVPDQMSLAAIKAGPGANGQAATASITMLDIGTGRCVVIACPDGSKYLNDCGSLQAAADPRITSARARSRALSIERPAENYLLYVVISHEDTDHQNLVDNFIGQRHQSNTSA